MSFYLSLLLYNLYHLFCCLSSLFCHFFDFFCHLVYNEKKKGVKIMNELAEKIRYERKKLKLKQKEIADKLNISVRTYQRYERWHNSLHPCHLLQLSPQHKWSPEEFIRLQTFDNTQNDLLQSRECLKKLMEYKGYKINSLPLNEDTLVSPKIHKHHFDTDYALDPSIYGYDIIEDTVLNDKINFDFDIFFEHVMNYLELYTKQKFTEFNLTARRIKIMKEIKKEQRKNHKLLKESFELYANMFGKEDKEEGNNTEEKEDD